MVGLLLEPETRCTLWTTKFTDHAALDCTHTLRSVVRCSASTALPHRSATGVSEEDRTPPGGAVRLVRACIRTAVLGHRVAVIALLAGIESSVPTTRRFLHGTR